MYSFFIFLKLNNCSIGLFTDKPNKNNIYYLYKFYFLLNKSTNPRINNMTLAKSPFVLPVFGNDDSLPDGSVSFAVTLSPAFNSSPSGTSTSHWPS